MAATREKGSSTTEPLFVEHERITGRARRIRRSIVFSFTIFLLCVWLARKFSTICEVVGIARFESEKSFRDLINEGLNIRDFNWTNLHPSENLHWVKCYEKFECARLTVPLDYAEPSGEKAAVALAKLPSVIPPNQDGYRGPILFNPGGPGGSGVSMILEAADPLRVLLGEDYDLIGFDPRGVGYTTPILKVFDTKSEEGAWILEDPIGMNSSKSALGLQYARFQIFGQLAESKARHVAEHVSTPVVARDMLSIVKAHGRDKLVYWGFSYGSVLGATYASMFPNNVGRLIIDGVVDSENYYAGLWSNNLRDTDTVLLNLYESCVDAGPSDCPLYENTTSLVQKRVDDILETLKTAPIPFNNPETGLYGVIDSSFVKSVIFGTLSSTHGLGKYLTIMLAELEKGNALPISLFDKSVMLKDMLSCECPAASPVHFGGGMVNTLAIACGDGDIVEDGLDGLRNYYANLAEASVFADLWVARVGCSGWTIRAKERYIGKAAHATNTSYPLLIIGNTADPVTPLWNAHKMSKSFNQSVVLTQNSPGHCSVSAVSLCTLKYVREYFRDGVLPPPGTVCEVESSIFGNGLNINLQTLSDDDQKLLKASRELQERYFIPTHF